MFVWGPMKITVYGNPLLRDPCATITWEDGKTNIHAENAMLNEELKKFYSEPLLVRRPVSSKGGVVAFKEEELIPGTEEFFKESVYSIRQLSLYGYLEGERKVQMIALDFDGTLWDSV